MSAVYHCPTCGAKMERDLQLFSQHTDEHIVTEIKRLHPEWVSADGFCAVCTEAYKAARRGESLPFNIAGPQITRRYSLAAISLVIVLLSGAYLLNSDAPALSYALLAVPLFGMFFGFFQAKRKTCAILGIKGTQNLGHSEEPVTDIAKKARLKTEAKRILFWTLLLTAVTTSLAVLWGLKI